MTSGLSAGDVAILHQAYGQVQDGDAASAAALVARLPVAARGHPDALMVAALAETAQGRPAAARPLLEAALQTAPHHAGIWNSYANLLDELGDTVAAIAAYQQALAIAPGSVPTWTNLALAAITARRWDVAVAAIDRALALAPGDARALAARGLLEQTRDQPQAAVSCYGLALAANPGDRAARHNLAAALRTLGRTDEALATLGQPSSADSSMLRGHLLGDLGRFDAAIAQYRAVVAVDAGHAPAHAALAELLPQIGRGGEALLSYDGALAGSASRELWAAAIGAARGNRDGGRMLEWASAAEARFGQQPDWALARVGALSLLGDRAAALAAAHQAAAAWPQAAGAAIFLAWLYLKDGDPARAEGHAIRASHLAPLEQSPWSLLTLVWRLMGDMRETWLADYENLVLVDTIATPAGWADLASFLADLSATLTRLHVTLQAPAEQSLRGGTQTRGSLFDTADPVLKALQSALSAAVDARLATLPRDASHPFLGRLTGGADMTGSWSVRLQAKGFHVNHIHHSGWLSSAFHVDLPGEIGTAAGDDAGKLLFGSPDAALAIDLSPRRIVTPAPGRLVLFPSYFWHGTAPFDSNRPRLSVAFDALPAS